MKNSSNIKSTNSALSRTPKWPEQDNVVLGELLLEQYMSGNILNGRLKRHMWKSVTTSLNRRLGTSYTESMVQTRFKNMKADFRAIYQLSNKSGWGWDDVLKLPVASDEIWNEVIQEEPKLARYRRNPFHQYDVFEKICAENVAIGTEARGTLPPVVNVEDEDETPVDGEHVVLTDEFMESNGISFVESFEVHDVTNQNSNEHLEPSQNTMGNSSGSKRNSIGTSHKSQRSKRRACKERLDNLLTKQIETSTILKDTISKHEIPTMRDCLIKLGELEELSTEGLLAVHDALVADDKNMVTLMLWNGNNLKRWIEHIVAKHPIYYTAPVWM